MRRKLRDWLKQLGPGLITGAADDDPERDRDLLAGRRAVRLSADAVDRRAHLSADGRHPDGQRAHRPRHRATGSRRTSAGTFRGRCSYAIVALLVVANTINIAADIAAMGEALQLVVGGPAHGLRGRVRRRLPAAAGLPALPALRPLPEVADARAARLRRRRVHDRHAVARGRARGIVWPQVALTARVR